MKLAILLSLIVSPDRDFAMRIPNSNDETQSPPMYLVVFGAFATLAVAVAEFSIIAGFVLGVLTAVLALGFVVLLVFRHR